MIVPIILTVIMMILVIVVGRPGGVVRRGRAAVLHLPEPGGEIDKLNECKKHKRHITNDTTRNNIDK